VRPDARQRLEVSEQLSAGHLLHAVHIRDAAHLLQVLSVELALRVAEANHDHVLALGRQQGAYDLVVLALDTAVEHAVEDVGPLLHEAHVGLRGVAVLPVVDRVHESVHELFARAEEVGLDERDHAVVLGQVVLERRARQNESSLGFHLESECD